MTLKELRIQSGKTVKEVAEALSVSVRAVFNYEYGLRHISLQQVLILAKFFDYTEKEIIEAQLNSQKTPKDNLALYRKNDIT